ncbi:DUF2793 domain-containing protein [Sphingomonas endophytica]|uniref:DUF2793 domain-containing protein n=1 Tax=Sphingomonas endophytica TaxID=869719 RepID=A0A147HUT0_9SPHN|nr:DUF2793 domain-containing protein [Sphingomonas endophytica]KTT68653.1 hypothetical protein NS334_16125 [Sphingomonas endophytica]
MTDEDTARLALPLLAAGQAQKETWHNEALALLDIAVQATVEEVGRNAPPAAPAPGACWIVGTAPSGDWADHAGAIAGWTPGGWRFIAPRAGFRAWHGTTGQEAVFDGTTWRRGEVRAARVLVDGQQVIGPRGAAIVMPTGGSTVDSEIRSCVATILNTLRDHGLIAI